MHQFQFTTRLVYGAGALGAIGRIRATRVLIVTDPGVARLGFVETVQRALPRDAETDLFAEVEADPSLDLCARGATQAEFFAPDAIVALGGGSAIDAAKAIWMLHSYTGHTTEALIGPFGKPRGALARRVQFVAIPTTSGTGSEVSRGMVVTDRGVTPHRKHVAYCDAPDLAIVDPQFPAAMPPRITADTGYDAFVHALEALVSTGASALTDAFAGQALRQIHRALPQSYAHGDDLAAREAMHTAATTAGLAMIAGLGLVHAMAHQLGAAYGIAHGRANALLLPHVLRFNARDQRAAARYRDAANLLGLGGPAGLVAAAEALREQIDLPATIADTLPTLDRAAFTANLEPLARNALADLSYTSTPRPATLDDVMGLYERAL